MSVSETLSAVGSILVFYNDENTNYRLFETDLCDSWDHVITSRFCYQLFIKHFLFSLSPLSEFWNENILSISKKEKNISSYESVTILSEQPIHATFWNVDIGPSCLLDKNKYLSQFRHTYPQLYYCHLICHLFNISNVNIPSNPLSRNKDNHKVAYINHDLDVLFEASHQSPYLCDEKDFIFNYKLRGELDPQWLLSYSLPNTNNERIKSNRKAKSKSKMSDSDNCAKNTECKNDEINNISHNSWQELYFSQSMIEKFVQRNASNDSKSNDNKNNDYY